MLNTSPHASGCVIGVVISVVVGSGADGSRPCQTVIGAAFISCCVGAGGFANINIDVTLTNSEMASLVMSVI
jgi:hypothetical protein